MNPSTGHRQLEFAQTAGNQLPPRSQMRKRISLGKKSAMSPRMQPTQAFWPRGSASAMS